LPAARKPRILDPARCPLPPPIAGSIKPKKPGSYTARSDKRFYTKQEGMKCEMLDIGAGSRDYESSPLDPAFVPGKAGRYPAIVKTLRRLRGVDSPRPRLATIQDRLVARGFAIDQTPAENRPRLYSRAWAPGRARLDVDMPGE
jgi:hypothetical protein